MMLTFLQKGGWLTGRKVQLFGVACCRRVWHLLADERARGALEVSERYADGHASADELCAAHLLANQALDAARAAHHRAGGMGDPGVRALLGAVHAVWAACAAASPVAGSLLTAGRVARKVQEAGEHTGLQGEQATQCNVIRCLFNPSRSSPDLPLPVQTWNGGLVGRMAEHIYQARRFADLPVLRDALLDAGCQDTALLEHLAGADGHVVGCWGLDALTGRR
jgi:hypothetical protein